MASNAKDPAERALPVALSAFAERIVVSNGFGRFHLRHAAEEAEVRGALAAFITGGYPGAALPRCAKVLGVARRPALGRLLARSARLSAQRVHALWAGEPLYQIANRLRASPAVPALAPDRLHLAARHLYSNGAARLVARIPMIGKRGIYHYRAGFGGASVVAARKRGWACLCDHSLVHPALLEHLVANRGRLPPEGAAGPLDANWRAILGDIAHADSVVVNSEFVRETFLHQGWNERSVHVVPWGIDDEFLRLIPPREPPDGPLRLLFAGSFGRRKGAFELAEALAKLRDLDWRLEICGPVEVDARATLRQLCADGRATHHGVMGASELARRMAAADLFVLPSLAEGSARVIYEALAAGCYVITTRNAGSIVVDGEHGRLVAPGCAAQLAAAIRGSALDRSRLARVGARNSAQVRGRYRQAQYGERLFNLYARLG